jgi:hypothetical protein
MSKIFSRLPLHARACCVGMLYRLARYSSGEATPTFDRNRFHRAAKSQLPIPTPMPMLAKPQK